MPSLRTVALATLVAIALLSVGVDAAARHSLGHHDPATCDDARLAAYPDDVDTATVAYENLSADARAAFDRARSDDTRTTEIEPELVSQFPAGVTDGETTYRTNARAFDCPVVAGVPGALDPLLLTFVFVENVFGGLYVPAGSVVAVVLAYRKVDAWLQFD